jgi:hypothetical protein
MAILLHSLVDYKILKLKKCLKIYRKYYHGTINELKYIISSKEWSQVIMGLISSRGP